MSHQTMVESEANLGKPPQLAQEWLDQLPSPALCFNLDVIDHNLRRMVALAGSPQRLRPHAKTHKTREIIRLEMALGINKHKCATLAEAEMLADCGVREVLIAYPMVGPNQTRLAQLIQSFPKTAFAVLVDDPGNLASLARTMVAAQVEVEGVLDLNVGQHRTGLAPGPDALALYEQLATTPGCKPGGVQVYDGHNTQSLEAERRALQQSFLHQVEQLLAQIHEAGWALPRIVLGGTPTFPLHAESHWTEAELSPGTCVLHDASYAERYPELGFQPAAWLLTRVVSRPKPDRVTLDLGSKALSPDLPLPDRCRVFGVDGNIVLQNEEHLVLQVEDASVYPIGAVAWAVPGHVCPSVALHRQAHIIHQGKLVGEWPIVARDRKLTI